MRKERLNVCLLQQALIWEDQRANLNKFEALMETIPPQTDIIVLPEAFNLGFTMQPEKFATNPEITMLPKLRDWAKKLNAAIACSAMVMEDERYFNRFYWVNPNGEISYYNKAHLFRMGEEQQHYEKGNNRIIIEYKGWRIAPFVCYDLRFPVWLRRTEEYNYDLMILVANWPERRSNHWKILNQARAIENQCWLLALNRVGNDGNGIYHSGDSMVVSPLGEIVWTLKDEEAVYSTELNFETVENYRNVFPVGLDADTFTLRF